MSKTPLLLIFLLLFCCWAAAPGVSAEEARADGTDTVLFNNGDRLSGQLVRVDNTVLELKSEALGDLTIRWSDIREVQSRNRRWRIQASGTSPDSHIVFRNAVLRNTDSMVRIEADSHLVLVPADASVKPDTQEHPAAGLTQLMGTKTSPAPPDTSLAVSLNAPESVVVGSQSQQVFGGAFRLLHNEPDLCAPPSWFTALLASANHNKTYKVATPAIVTDTFDETLSLTNQLGSQNKVAGYLVADLFGNSSLGIGLQQSYGLGITGTVFTNGCRGTTAIQPAHYRLAVNGDASIRYIHQRLYAPGISEDLAGLRLGENLAYTPLFKGKDGTLQERFTIDQSLWVVPMLNLGSAVQAGGSLSITFPVNQSLSIGLSEEDEFFNNAPKAKRKNYSKSALTVTYTFPPAPK